MSEAVSDDLLCKKGPNLGEVTMIHLAAQKLCKLKIGILGEMEGMHLEI